MSDSSMFDLSNIEPASASCITEPETFTPGTAEVNPLHRQIIDVVGRRYIAGGSAVFTFLVGGTLLF